MTVCQRARGRAATAVWARALVGYLQRMPTIYHITPNTPCYPCDEAIAETARTLDAGGLALMPTETVYGIGAAVEPLMRDVSSTDSGDSPRVNGAPLPPEECGYRRIFSVKHRALTQTVPWLVGGMQDLTTYGRGVDALTQALAEAFWPGALTLIVRAREDIPAFMQAADGTVALRQSASPVVGALIAACESPLATTSANSHGAPAPISFRTVEGSVLAGVDIAIDAGETTCRDASTIVSCLSGAPVIVRHGAISDDEILRAARTAGWRESRADTG